MPEILSALFLQPSHLISSQITFCEIGVRTLLINYITLFS